MRGTYSVLREFPDGTLWQVDERRMPSGFVVVLTNVATLFGRTRDELLAQGKERRQRNGQGIPGANQPGPIGLPLAARPERATRELRLASSEMQEGYCMSRRFSPLSREAEVETKASHQVMELVRKSPELSRLVVQLRDQGQSWRDVQAAIEAKVKSARSRRPGRQGNTPETPDRT